MKKTLHHTNKGCMKILLTLLKQRNISMPLLKTDKSVIDLVGETAYPTLCPPP